MQKKKKKLICILSKIQEDMAAGRHSKQIRGGDIWEQKRQPGDENCDFAVLQTPVEALGTIEM